MTKPLRDAYDHRGEIMEKAKDLPMAVLQTALSGVGHALLIGDRVRSTIRRLGAPEEKPGKSPTSEAEKPARREPVIFAPRPTAPAADLNQEPEPAPKPAAEPQPTAEPKLDSVPKPKAEPKPAAEPLPNVEPKLNSTPKPKAEPEPKAEPKPKAAPRPSAEPKLDSAPKPVAEPKPNAELDSASKPVAEPQADTAVVTPAKKAAPAEPIPGYADLTIASLRARMRGKSALEIQQLIAYEEATSARPEVTTMYRNRLTKLESGI
ncbi:hypothetical protein [Acrocarpospora pleiomorpha]|uniref:hypothetical protein n=1 Tax=Acrocarpospora pleiomorpha TaxID=90975 RepID=UPI0012D2DFB7|nr:hypothetical protein [Acrocarpospora pleiomorpha]